MPAVEFQRKERKNIVLAIFHLSGVIIDVLSQVTNSVYQNSQVNENKC